MKKTVPLLSFFALFLVVATPAFAAGPRHDCDEDQHDDHAGNPSSCRVVYDAEEDNTCEDVYESQSGNIMWGVIIYPIEDLLIATVYCLGGTSVTAMDHTNTGSAECKRETVWVGGQLRGRATCTQMTATCPPY